MERHTRQNTNAGNPTTRHRRQASGKHPDELSRDLGRNLYSTALEDWDAYRALVPISCWCNGTICSRDPDTGRVTWPGMADGAPHPRETPETWQDAARRLPGGRS